MDVHKVRTARLYLIRAARCSSSFLIAGGLYSVTALRKTGAEVTVYAKHKELKQACKHASAKTRTRVSSRCAWRRRPAPRPLSLPLPWSRLPSPSPVPPPRLPILQLSSLTTAHELSRTYKRETPFCSVLLYKCHRTLEWKLALTIVSLLLSSPLLPTPPPPPGLKEPGFLHAKGLPALLRWLTALPAPWLRWQVLAALMSIATKAGISLAHSPVSLRLHSPFFRRRNRSKRELSDSLPLSWQKRSSNASKKSVISAKALSAQRRSSVSAILSFKN